jgi:hypothetical protein
MSKKNAGQVWKIMNLKFEKIMNLIARLCQTALFNGASMEATT